VCCAHDYVPFAHGNPATLSVEKDLVEYQKLFFVVGASMSGNV
jgi:hypothetical protein